MAHIVLLGDSTLDNAAYVPDGQDVASHLRSISQDSKISLLAIDGSVIGDIAAQLERLPADVSHLVVSVGGNDAILASGVLDESTTSLAAALDRLADVREAFRAAYRTMLDEVLAQGIATAVCTIYEGADPDPTFRRIASTALAMLNDCITREAAARALPLIDLRVIFDSDEDYANPIEPSASGGHKFAAAIASVVAGQDFGGRPGILAYRVSG